jgi:hypothetical protein
MAPPNGLLYGSYSSVALGAPIIVETLPLLCLLNLNQQ